jgi:hypothetical protein
MANRETTRPITFLFLLLPYGISTGFASITLPFFLTRAGFSVASAAAIPTAGRTKYGRARDWRLQRDCLRGWMFARRLGRRVSRTLVVLLRVRSRPRSCCDRHGLRAANFNVVRRGRFGLRVLRRHELRGVFGYRRARDRSRRCLDQIRYLSIARKYSGRVHDRIRRLGTRSLRHSLDAQRGSVARFVLRWGRAVRFAPNKCGTPSSGSSLIK